MPRMDTICGFSPVCSRSFLSVESRFRPARRGRVGSLCSTFIAFLWLVAPVDSASIQYTVSFPSPHNHYLEVEAEIPADGDTTLVRLATWTPGSYLIREYSRQIEDVAAKSVEGQSLPLQKVAKNRWRVATKNVPRFKLTYRVYARELSVRTNWVDEEFAMLNGAPTFITRVEGGPFDYVVNLELPRIWKESYSGLERIRSQRPGWQSYRARDYDELVDCPIVAGNPAVYSFEVAGKSHRLVNIGEGGIWNGERSARDLRLIVEENLALWGDLPYSQYTFFNVIAESGGGLEHRNSTLMLTSRWRSNLPESYRGWLGLASHEFFHTWNVKRLRPVELGPFDYEEENYTESLWIVEGTTSYYDDLNLVRSGLMTQKQYLKALSKSIERVETTPGRKVRSLTDSSFDAWIKFYRPDENSANTNISYYTKGAVVSFLLDMEIRRRTQGNQDLDDVLKLAYSRYSGPRGYRLVDFYNCVTETSGVDLGPWFRKYVEGTEELNYDRALDYLGLRFKPIDDQEEEKTPGEEEGDEPTESEEEKVTPGWLGLVTQVRSGQLRVARVVRETPAYQSGFNVGDEILAIDNYRVDASQWKNRLKQYAPGTEAVVLIARRERLMTIPVTFGEKPKNRWKLEVHPEATDEQKSNLAAWLAGHAKPREAQVKPSSANSGG